MLMVLNLREIHNLVLKMVMERKLGLMKPIIKVNLIMDLNMDMEKKFHQIINNTKDNGKMDSNTGKLNKQIKMVNFKNKNGLTVK